MTMEYIQACDELKQVIQQAAALKKSVLDNNSPPSAEVVIFEEAFAILNSSIFGNGLDEEAQTAAFLTSLAAAAKIWATCWLWEKEIPPDICWVHYNKTSEAKIGADFALIVSLPTETNEPVYRMVIMQAKRLNLHNDKISVEQPNFRSPQANKPAHPSFELAQATLRSLLGDGPQEINFNQENYQLSKLIALQNEFLVHKNEFPAPEILYAVWRDDGKEPLYITLDEVKKDITKSIIYPKEKMVKIPQSIKVNFNLCLREWLIDFSKSAGVGSMSKDQAEKAFDVANKHCSATIVLDLNKVGLKNELKKTTIRAPLNQPRPKGSSILRM